MRRRTLLKRVAASGAAAAGVGGVASAQSSPEGNYVAVTIDGEQRTLTHEEYEAHPETGSLDDVTGDKACLYTCCECCHIYCPDRPCDCTEYCGDCRR